MVRRRAFNVMFNVIIVSTISRMLGAVAAGLKHPDKPMIFIKNVRNHPYHQFYPVLAKIRINRGLLYCVPWYHKSTTYS